MTKSWVWLSVLLAGCAVEGNDDVVTASNDQAVTSANRLASNRLASNRLASNRLASNSLGAAALTSADLVDSEDGREVLSYIVSCALPADESVTVQDSAGTSYTFPGSIGLAPGWATGTPSVSDRRWVTACLLARTNYYGVSVQLSMRGANDALATDAAEEAAYGQLEGAFYGDLFDANGQSWNACGTSADPINHLRLCTISEDGTTTKCGFTYTHLCGAADETNPAACSGGAPYASCDGSGATWSEVITIFLQ